MPLLPDSKKKSVGFLNLREITIRDDASYKPGVTRNGETAVGVMAAGALEIHHSTTPGRESQIVTTLGIDDMHF